MACASFKVTIPLRELDNSAVVELENTMNKNSGVWLLEGVLCLLVLLKCFMNKIQMCTICECGLYCRKQQIVALGEV